MHHDHPIGQPIPTAVLTPTDIETPTKTALSAVEAEVGGSIDDVGPATAPTDLFIEMMFAPLRFWTSMSAHYLSLFDLADEQRTALQRFH